MYGRVGFGLHGHFNTCPRSQRLLEHTFLIFPEYTEASTLFYILVARFIDLHAFQTDHSGYRAMFRQNNSFLRYRVDRAIALFALSQTLHLPASPPQLSKI